MAGDRGATVLSPAVVACLWVLQGPTGSCCLLSPLACLRLPVLSLTLCSQGVLGSQQVSKGWFWGSPPLSRRSLVAQPLGRASPQQPPPVGSAPTPQMAEAGEE